MPRTTYGSEPKKRVKRLLEALLCFAAGEFADYFDIQSKWQEDSEKPKLIVETTLVTLDLLTQKDKYPGKLTKPQIREALNLLKDFLNILEDNRIQTQGSEDWRFTLTLWAKDTETNLKRVEEEWENKKLKKSKKPQPSFKKAEEVTTAPVDTRPKISIFQAPPLPAHFVERPEYSEDLKTRLLNCSSSESRTLVITAIHGLGSVGKSTIAAALAHDAEVQTRFSDGIIWATLGQQPDVLSLLSGWVQALGDYSFKPTSVEATSTHLRTLLYDKAVLLVVDDAYVHQHLVWHLEKAGQVAEIHSLLREESVTGKNGWYEIREKLGQTGGYITDISRAWELAEANWHESTLPLVVSLQCRYALMIASVNSLAANVPAELLLVLVKNNVWTAEQGLAYALQNPNPVQKAKSLTGLVSYLPPNLQNLSRQKALTAAMAIENEYHRAQSLIALADKFPEILPEALTAARAIQDENDLAQSLIALADKLPEILPEALSAARAIQNEYDRTQSLIALADKLPIELLPEALIATQAIWSEYDRARSLIALADKLPIELLPEALTVARAIWSKYDRAQSLIALADKLPEILPEALTAARAIQSEYDRAQSLIALAEKLPEILPEALTTARAIQSEYDRAQTLIALGDKLPQTLPEALTTVKAVQDERYRALALSALANKLPTEFLPKALSIARAIKDERYYAQALNALAEKLPEILPEALNAAKAIQTEYDRTQALKALADKLPEILPETLIAARVIQDEEYCALALSALADKLPTELLSEVLTAAKGIRSEHDRALALSALAEQLPSELLPEALTAARAIQNEFDRAQSLIALADKLPEILPEALTAATAIQDEEFCALALSALANKLPRELFPQALTAAMAIEDEEYSTLALSALVEQLLSERLPKTLITNIGIQSEDFQTNALSALSDDLSPMPLAELFALWQNTLHKLSVYTRPNLLLDIETLFPVIFTLGGEYATAEVARAIADVARWWR